MLQVTKKVIILLGMISISFGVAYAATSTSSQIDTSQSYNPLIDSMVFESSRFSQPADERIVPEEDFIEITRNDDLILENDYYQLYLNEETLGMKVLNKSTNYVWSTAIDDAEAGTYSGLLSSGIGFEYINSQQNFKLNQNIGVSETAFSFEMIQEDNTLNFDVEMAGFCPDRRCQRAYDQYLTNPERVSLEDLYETYGYTDLGISFSFEVTLTDNGLDFYLPLESVINETPDEFLLSSFIIFPGMGATYMDHIPGYMVIPDGNGALIRYEDNEGKFITPYETSYFGVDYGVDNSESALNRYGLSLPIFGAVHGNQQNAFLGVIESGATAAKLNAYPNGARNIDYNLIYNRFVLKQVYRQTFTSDGSASALRLFDSANEDIALSYAFLDGNQADYVGMALAYQDKLVNEGTLNNQLTADNEIPIHFQYLMSDSKSQFIGKSLIEMTTVSEVDLMYDFFMNAGLRSQRVSLLGWNDGGYSGHLPTDIDFENSLGSTKSFKALIAKIEANNELLLVNNYLVGSNASDDVSYGQDVAEAVDRMKIEWESDHGVYPNSYLLYPEFSNKDAIADLDNYQDLGVEVLFESIGTHLFSYYDRDLFTRSDALAYYLEIFEAYENQAQYNRPNYYAFKGIEAYYSMPIYNNQYNFFDDLVPLLPIVLSGYVEMFSDQLNYNSQGTQLLLMMIDFNIYPTYGLTMERPSMLSGTDAEYFFSSDFDSWKDTIVSEYGFINMALSSVMGETVVSRLIPENGVSVVTYSNNVQIIVNYTHESISYDGETITPLSYLVRGE